MRTSGLLSRWGHLIYLANLLWLPVFSPTATWVDWTLVAVVVVLFLPMYAVAWQRPDRARWTSTVPTVLLGALVTPFNSGAAVLFVYAAAIAGFTESRRAALRWFIGMTALLSACSVYSTVPLPWRMYGMLPSLILLWLIGSFQIEWAERERAQADLRLRNARVEHLATLAERQRIARDLHDLLGQSLTAITMRAQLVNGLIDVDGERARGEAAEIERTSRAALTEIRAVVSGWRQATLEGELESARNTLASTGVEVTVQWDAEVSIVDSTEHELALALREATTNVARHASARTCHIGLEVVQGELRLVVADDGVGGKAPDGNGLSGMRERISALGGEVRRTGAAGTTVTIAVPVEVAA
ncbi:sensor histidine kinase [Saccharopolyspora sp. WRP15-2]|uniref:Sensor histidine kinase n=1 Tax=Saccharopolyspora oryzae TaxID=2997343 RepID=A0ABT4V5L3_9PSEU|nr:sensor histidine kinase [Saccharopolyspora oryzae]MDA3629242.1 sensor histidine kinase [Saccharopolyspora oryzae]